MSSITDILRRFKQNWTEELSPQAIAQACRDVGMKWYESALSPVVTIQIFFLQILHGNTACEHLTHLSGLLFTAAAYCKARMRLSLEALHLLLQRCVEGLQQETFGAGRWLGHRVFHVDGSSFSMPDTPELHAHFGQQGQQKPGCGFPIAHWLQSAAPSETLPNLVVNTLRMGRIEPRVRKRRPKQYPLMCKPRKQLKKVLEN